jgi:hypothetical protein
MKAPALFLLTFISSLSLAHATNINVGFKNIEYGQYTEILQGQVSWAQESFDTYAEEALGCSRVRMNLNIIKEPGIFRKGAYDVSLTANCTEIFSNFNFKFYHGYDEDYTTLDVSYVKDGKTVKQGFKTRAWY